MRVRVSAKDTKQKGIDYVRAGVNYNDVGQDYRQTLLYDLSSSQLRVSCTAMQPGKVYGPREGRNKGARPSDYNREKHMKSSCSA